MKYVILGNGPAGVSALKAILEEDPAGDITIVAPETWRCYSKVLLTHWIAGKVRFPNLFLVDEDFYKSNGVKTVFGAAATRIDPEGKVVELSNRQRLGYDRLLLAMGSSPQVPEVRGIRLPGVHYLRTLDDAERITQAVSSARRAAVIGGGLVSLKAAESFLARGLEVWVVVSSGRLLSQITAPEDARPVLRAFEGVPGLHIVLDCDVAGIEGAGRVEEVILSTGQRIACDLVVVGKGVTPNLICTRGSGIATGQGVLVNDRMETSIPGIFAAGDIAEGFDIARGRAAVNALWSSAVWQGRIAGYNMAGRDVVYAGDVAMNSVTFRGACIVALGKTRPTGDDEVYVLSRTGEDGDDYARFVFSGDRMVSAVLIGSAVRTAGVLRSLIACRCDVSRIKARLSWGGVSYPSILKDIAGLRAVAAS
ncbi:MAG: FAD-dependent oxidoreductase [Firmicutes bacterium]|jgi:NAD(P)H-nitrite reductase large subunit|nr:FAD-dependent oxidoreductase [Bacillota bacterium]MDH7495944.1 FAD-dependent oxidoreductase [Bacillota bacterium]